MRKKPFKLLPVLRNNERKPFKLLSVLRNNEEETL